MQFLPKSCPKCHGDMVARTDTYGPFLSCVQCSHQVFLPAKPREVRKPQPVEAVGANR
jgi:hypothetical protein